MFIEKKLKNIKSLPHKLYLSNPRLFTISTFAIIILAGAFVYYLRYPYNYTFSNFYAEDGKIFMKNIIELGPVEALFQPFNGYLIIGVYGVTAFGWLLNSIFGSGFWTSAQFVAVASYIFLGLITCLPVIIFKKRLGLYSSIVLLLLLLLTPLGGYDYAVFGTTGNLKYAFMFIAFLLVVYRIDKNITKKPWQYFLVDATFILCALTNMLVIALLPLLLLQYKEDIIRIFKLKKINLNFDKISLLCLIIIVTTYTIIVMIHGLTSIPGYLDGPIEKSAIPAILYRGSFYGFIYPITKLLNGFTLSFIFVVITMFMIKSKYKLNLFILCYVLLVNTLGFVYSRPGVTSLFRDFNDINWPGHFFYAGTMIFTFGIIYIYHREINMFIKNHNKFYILILTILTITFMAPYSGSRFSFNELGTKRPTLKYEIDNKCSKNTKQIIDIEIFPSEGWKMQIDKNIACPKYLLDK